MVDVKGAGYVAANATVARDAAIPPTYADTTPDCITGE